MQPGETIKTSYGTFTIGEFISDGAEGEVYALNSSSVSDPTHHYALKVFFDSTTLHTNDLNLLIDSFGAFIKGEFPKPECGYPLELIREEYEDDDEGDIGLLMYRFKTGQEDIQTLKDFERPFKDGPLIKQLSRTTRSKIARELAQQVSLFHQHNFIIGDLKPENIMIRIEGDEVTLGFVDMDSFGIPDSVDTFTATNGYRAPERNGDGTATPATPATDNFALGIIIVWLLLEDEGPFDHPPTEGEDLGIQGHIDQGYSWLAHPDHETWEILAREMQLRPLSMWESSLRKTVESYLATLLRDQDSRPTANEWAETLTLFAVHSMFEPSARESAQPRSSTPDEAQLHSLPPMVGKSQTLSQATGRLQDYKTLPRAIRELTHGLYQHMPQRFRDPEAVALISDTSGAMLAYRLILAFTLVSLSVPPMVSLLGPLVAPFDWLPPLLGLILALPLTIIFSIEQDETVRSGALPRADHSFWRTIRTLSTSLFNNCLVLIPLAAFAVLVCAYIAPPAEDMFLLLVSGVLLIPLVFILPIDGYASMRVTHSRFTCMPETPRFPPPFYFVTPSTSAVETKRTLWLAIQFILAILGGMSPANTMKYQRLWGPYSARGSLVAAAALLAFISAYGVAISTLEFFQPFGILAGIAWAFAAANVLRHALRLHETAIGRPSWRWIVRFTVVFECLITGAVTALFAVTAIHLTEFTATWPPSIPSFESGMIGLTAFLLCLALFVLPLMPIPSMRAKREMYAMHMDIIERARQEEKLFRQ